jgi:hypothetical protein
LASSLELENAHERARLRVVQGYKTFARSLLPMTNGSFFLYTNHIKQFRQVLVYIFHTQTEINVFPGLIAVYYNVKMLFRCHEPLAPPLSFSPNEIDFSIVLSGVLAITGKATVVQLCTCMYINFFRSLSFRSNERDKG